MYMGILTFWKKEDKKEIDLYKAIVIKRLLDDVEELRNKVATLEIYNNSIKKPNKTEPTTILTPKETDIYDFINKSPRNASHKLIESHFKLSAVSVRIYCSRIRQKGYVVPKIL